MTRRGPTSCCGSPASTTAPTDPLAGTRRQRCSTPTHTLPARRCTRWPPPATSRALAELLDRTPEVATQKGGPFRWAPLLYLTYSRLDRGDALATARLLLDRGADPNAGYLWEGMVPPFTALTGVFGRGEQGAPPHRDELPLARLLLDDGADPNDGQTIYNRGLGDIARDDTEFLALLLDFGLGRGDGGPWYQRLGPALGSPADLAHEALHHAADNGLRRRVRLLLDRGADANIGGDHPAFEGRTPYEGAVLYGHSEIAEMLAAAGADTTTVDDISRLAGEVLAGDRSRLVASAVPRLLEREPLLLHRAAEQGRADGVRLLAEIGYDVNLHHRTTPLHEAALRGDMGLVRLLVDLGADPTTRDGEHDSTPRGWAEFAGHVEVARYLASLEP